jgi:hypothetical protein
VDLFFYLSKDCRTSPVSPFAGDIDTSVGANLNQLGADSQFFPKIAAPAIFAAGPAD